MKIKVKLLEGYCEPMIIEKGEWIDLYSAGNYELRSPFANTLKRNTKGDYRTVEFNTSLIKLGVIIQIPEGCEAILAPRSSTFKRWGILQTNSIGVIDSSYCGPDDEWKFPCVALQDTQIRKGDKICQFRIQLSQKATLWQKLKWLFSNKIEIEIVDKIDAPNRGGFGTTGN